MIIKYDKKITDKFPELYDSIQGSFLDSLIYYVIDSKYRKSVNLKSWIKGLTCEIPSDLIRKPDMDEQVITVLRWVQKNIKYKKDKDVWSISEKWQTPTETLEKKTGDCEDGAILIYVLCRKLGVSSNRLLLFCGDVKGGGHCWLGYKPSEYPLNYVFLDWCYWYNKEGVDLRHKFYIRKDSTIFEQDTKSNYLKVWFGFNEDVSIRDFTYSPLNRKSK